MMTNAKHKEEQEFQDRSERFAEKFNDASSVVDHFIQSKFLTVFPKDKRSQELLEQFFMACALKDLVYQRKRVFKKIEQHLDKDCSKISVFTEGYLNSVALPHQEKLEAEQ